MYITTNQINKPKIVPFLKFKFLTIIKLKMPGPASTVEERSLRKFSSEGTAVRSPPRKLLFRPRKHLCLTEIHQSDGFFQSRNLDAKSCARSILLCERERSPNKLAHESHYATLRNLLVGNKLTNLIYDGVEPLIGNRPRWKVPQPSI